MIQLYIIYRSFTLDPVTQIGWEWKMEDIFHANSNWHRAGVMTLISEKIKFKWKIIARDKEDVIYWLKGQSRRFNDHKHRQIKITMRYCFKPNGINYNLKKY